MRIVRQLLSYLLLGSILFYGVKRHTDTVQLLFGSVVTAVTSPFKTSEKILASEVTLGFPEGYLDVLKDFERKLPNEKDFFLSEEFLQEPLIFQRSIEYRFPKLLNKDAQCGFVSVKDEKYAANYNVVEEKGGYKIVCRL